MKARQTAWLSEKADRVRNQPLPGCYKIAGPDGARMADFPKPEYARLDR